MSIIERETAALQELLATDGDQPESCFVEQALALIEERKLLVDSLNDSCEFLNDYSKSVDTLPSRFDDAVSLKELKKSNSFESYVSRGFDSYGNKGCDESAQQSRCSSSCELKTENCSVREGEQAAPVSVNETVEIKSQFNTESDDGLCSPAVKSIANYPKSPQEEQLSCHLQGIESKREELDFQLQKEQDVVEAGSPSVKSKSVYFYQATDGSHVYMHYLNMSMLSQEYGSLEYSPHVITARILEKVSSCVNMRKKVSA